MDQRTQERIVRTVCKFEEICEYVEENADCKIVLTATPYIFLMKMINECHTKTDLAFEKMFEWFVQEINARLWVEIALLMSGKDSPRYFLAKIAPPDHEPNPGSMYDVYRRSETFYE